MKIRPVTKLYKRNYTTSKKVDNFIKPASCVVIVIFMIYGQFVAIQNPDSVHIVCKTYIFSKSNFLSFKN